MLSSIFKEDFKYRFKIIVERRFVEEIECLPKSEKSFGFKTRHLKCYVILNEAQRNQIKSETLNEDYERSSEKSFKFLPIFFTKFSENP